MYMWLSQANRFKYKQQGFEQVIVRLIDWGFKTDMERCQTQGFYSDNHDYRDVDTKHILDILELKQ